MLTKKKKIEKIEKNKWDYNFGPSHELKILDVLDILKFELVLQSLIRTRFEIQSWKMR